MINELIGIQRKFLWRGLEGGRCISWVSWKDVCKYKEAGGLGIRDINSMNVSLLMKWKWQILMEENAVWFNLLRFRYSNPELKMFMNDIRVLNKHDYIW